MPPSVYESMPLQSLSGPCILEDMNKIMKVLNKIEAKLSFMGGTLESEDLDVIFA
jgi:hypothetical protein